MVKSRIAILDGFRAIAILAVMFFHFFSRWTEPLNEVSLYPYGSKLDYFRLGYLGVNFFFIISGFVIFFTLDNTSYFLSFWKKRFIRLMPSIIIASLLTFLIFIVFDNSFLFPESHKIKNLLPSWTFINPAFFNEFSSVTKTNFDYIDGSYWSLWPEIQFYLFSSILFYLNKKKFVRNFVIVSLLLVFSDYIIMYFFQANITGVSLPTAFEQSYNLWFHDIFNLIKYLPFFGMGVLFYQLFKNKNNGAEISWLIVSYSVVFLFCAFYGAGLRVKLFDCIMYLIFIGFIYYPAKLSLFENKKLVSIGVSSYFLYLIHQNVGVLLINKLGHYLYPVSFLFTILLFYVLILLSRIFTEKIDRPFGRKLKKLLVIKE